MAGFSSFVSVRQALCGTCVSRTGNTTDVCSIVQGLPNTAPPPVRRRLTVAAGAHRDATTVTGPLENVVVTDYQRYAAAVYPDTHHINPSLPTLSRDVLRKAKVLRQDTTQRPIAQQPPTSSSGSMDDSLLLERALRYRIGLAHQLSLFSPALGRHYV